MEESSLRSSVLLDLDHSLAGRFLRDVAWPWEILSAVGSLILTLGPMLPHAEYEQIDVDIWVARDCCIAPSASITGPLIVGHETDIRHGAFIRTAALIGDYCVVGNSTELKNAILFDRVQVPHFNYIGDSVLGYKVHFGAGAVTSNVKSDRTLISIRLQDRVLETGLRKFGAIVGDNCEIGCNSVLNPGSIMGRNSRVYPLSFVRGFIPADHILKRHDELVPRQKE